MLEEKLRNRTRAKAHLCNDKGLRTPKMRAGRGGLKWNWAVQKPRSPVVRNLGP